MPQVNPFPPAKNPANQGAPLQVDAAGALIVSGVGGTNSKLDISVATVVKATPGRLVRISVLTAGTTPGTANDCATTAAAAIGNEIFSIPNTVGAYTLEWPCMAGIVIAPGTGQVVSVSFA